MNLRDPCVWNVNADGIQLTIMFHVDDILLGHDKPSAAAECAKKLDGVCGLIDPFIVTRVKHYEF